MKMAWQEFEKMINKELTIDRTKIGEEAGRNPLYVQKYIDLWLKSSRELNIKQREFEKLLKVKMEYYKTSYNLIPETVKEMDIMLNGDEEVSDIKKKITELNDLVYFFNQTTENFKNRGWMIKNIIEYLKFIEGAE